MIEELILSSIGSLSSEFFKNLGDMIEKTNIKKLVLDQVYKIVISNAYLQNFANGLAKTTTLEYLDLTNTQFANLDMVF